jgi:hypothetical protein
VHASARPQIKTRNVLMIYSFWGLLDILRQGTGGIRVT